MKNDSIFIFSITSWSIARKKRFMKNWCPHVRFITVRPFYFEELERKSREMLINSTLSSFRRIVPFRRQTRVILDNGRMAQNDERKYVNENKSRNEPLSLREVLYIGLDNEHAFSNQVLHCHPAFIVYHNTIHWRVFIVNVSYYSACIIIPLCKSAVRSWFCLSFHPFFLPAFLSFPSFCFPLFRSSKWKHLDLVTFLGEQGRFRDNRRNSRRKGA